MGSALKGKNLLKREQFFFPLEYTPTEGGGRNENDKSCFP